MKNLAKTTISSPLENACDLVYGISVGVLEKLFVQHEFRPLRNRRPSSDAAWKKRLL